MESVKNPEYQKEMLGDTFEERQKRAHIRFMDRKSEEERSREERIAFD